MKISIQYHQVGDRYAAKRDPRAAVARQVVERPTPPRVGDTVIDELSGGELTMMAVVWVPGEDRAAR
jgi:hypothetical protein